MFFFLLFGLFIALLHNIFVSTAFVLVTCLLTCQSRGFIFLAAKPLLITLTPSPNGGKGVVRNRSMVFSTVYLLDPYSEQRMSKPPSSPHKLARPAVCFLLVFRKMAQHLWLVNSVLPSHLSCLKDTRCIFVQLSFVYRVHMLWKAIVIF